MKKIIVTLLFIVTVFSGNFIFTPKLAFAQDAPADKFELRVAVDNPICDTKGGTGCTTTIKDLIAKILKVVIEFAIPVIIVMVIYSGFLYVIARGKPESIEKAHKTLTWTLIGAAIILGAQLISNVIIDTVSNISKDSGISNSNITNSKLNNSNSGSNNNNGTVNPVNNANGINGGVVLNNNTNTIGDNITQKDPAKEPTGSQNDTLKKDTVVIDTKTPDPVVTTPPANNSPIAGTLKQYYVNAPNGANLRSDPSTTTSTNIISKNLYGTILNVSGETSGFWNIFKSDKTFLGYTSKSLLTLGSKAPIINTGTSSGPSSTVGSYVTKLTYTRGPDYYNRGVGYGKFSATMTSAFTPKSLKINCVDQVNGSYALSESNPFDIQFTQVRSYTAKTYTTDFKTIRGTGKHNCSIVYELNSKSYTSNTIVVDVPVETP